MKRSIAVVVVLLVAVAAFAGRASPARAGTNYQVRGDWLPLDRNWKRVDPFIVRNNVYISDVHQTIFNTGYPGFAVTRYWRRNPRFVGSFPDVQYGESMWGLNTRGSRLPLQVRAVRGLGMHAFGWLSRDRGQTGNFSEDMWFTQNLPGEHGRVAQRGPVTTRAELMLWFRYRNVHVVTDYRVYLDHRWWDVAHWITGLGQGGGYRWQYIQFRAATQVNRWGGSILPMVHFAERHGWIRPAWYLSSMNIGFEIWNLGRGDHVRSYSVYVRP